MFKILTATNAYQMCLNTCGKQTHIKYDMKIIWKAMLNTDKKTSTSNLMILRYMENTTT
jgi:hypothetical protein